MRLPRRAIFGAELAQLIRYGLVGASLMIGYLSLAFGLVVFLGIRPTRASPSAFLLCLPLAYWAQAKFVFRARSDDWVQRVRFGIAALVNLAIVTFAPILGMLLKSPYQINILVGAFLLPVANYLVSRVWVFRILPEQPRHIDCP